MKLDRLLSRIRAALLGHATEFEQRALAAEYAEECAKVVERLEHIVPLIRQGQDFPALQIAESPPPVLDLVRQLSFAEAEKWYAHCLQHGLPPARPFDERSVDLVNKLYGKKISETHPLYREYRQAIRLRREDEALRVLRSIRRVNPDDTNAQAEFARLAHKIFEQRRAALDEALAGNDAHRALALMDAIETDSLPGRDQSATWQQAQNFRETYHAEAARRHFLDLAAQMRQTQAAGQWRAALPLLSEWDLQRNQFTFPLPEDAETAAGQIREWATGQLTAQEKDTERKQHWRDLGAYLDKLAREEPDNKTTRTLTAELAHLREHARALAADAQGLPGEQPPPDLLPRLEQETARLQIRLRQRHLRAAGFAAAALVVLALLLAAAYWYRQRTQLRETELAAIQQHFKDGATKALADTLKEYDAHFHSPEADPAMGALLTQARDFVNAHQAVVDRFDKELAQINDSAANPSSSQIHELLASLDKLEKETTALGADDAQRGTAAVQNLRVRLNQRLASLQDSRAARLADIAKRARGILEEKLALPMTAEAAQPLIADAKTILAEADSLPVDAAATSASETEARAQLADLNQKVETLTVGAHDALVSRGQLGLVRNLDDYHAAIMALVKNPLASETSAAAARALTAKNSDWADVAQRILLPGDAETWAFLKQVGEARVLPKEHNQAEDLAFTKLINNNALNDIHRAELVTYADGEETAREPVALAGLPKEKSVKLETVEELQQTANKINPDGSAAELALDWKQFTGRKPSGQKLENIKLTPEAQLLTHVRGAYSRDLDTIAQPLLRVLDDVRAEPGVSPVFKAYVEQELLQIMQNRPRDWGLKFSPKAQAAAQELGKITGGHLQPADWLFTAPTARLAANLQAFYDRTAADDYFEDAMTNLQALLKKHATVLRFAGYVDLTGTAHSLAPGGVTLWGMDTAGNWSALYHASPDGPPAAISSAQPARLTPLVFPQENVGGGL
jgi:hypothetical protein